MKVDIAADLDVRELRADLVAGAKKRLHAQLAEIERMSSVLLSTTFVPPIYDMVDRLQLVLDLAKLRAKELDALQADYERTMQQR